MKAYTNTMKLLMPLLHCLCQSGLHHLAAKKGGVDNSKEAGPPRPHIKVMADNRLCNNRDLIWR